MGPIIGRRHRAAGIEVTKTKFTAIAENDFIPILRVRLDSLPSTFSQVL